MNSGRFDKRVTIQKLKTTPDPPARLDPTDDDSWETYATRWAEIVETTGREYEHSDKVQSDVTHRVTLMFDSLTRSIQTAMRVRWIDTYDGEDVVRKLNIENRVISKSPRMVVQLQCKELI